MFMAADRQPKMRAMVMARTEPERRAALAELLPLQQADFEGLFATMPGRPVTIRLLDPPLHEFLPDRVQLAQRVQQARDERAPELPRSSRSSSSSCAWARSTRCSARAAAGWASCIPRSTRCRSRRSCAPPARPPCRRGWRS